MAGLLEGRAAFVTGAASGLGLHLAEAGSWVTVITGAVFVVCVLAFRRGIVGEVRALVKRSFVGVKA